MLDEQFFRKALLAAKVVVAEFNRIEFFLPSSCGNQRATGVVTASLPSSARYSGPGCAPEIANS
jgi:hypothetical protein